MGIEVAHDAVVCRELGHLYHPNVALRTIRDAMQVPVLLIFGIGLMSRRKRRVKGNGEIIVRQPADSESSTRREGCLALISIKSFFRLQVVILKSERKRIISISNVEDFRRHGSIAGDVTLLRYAPQEAVLGAEGA